MHVRFLQRWLRDGLPEVEPGQLLELPDLTARALIADGKAVRHDPASTPAPVEAAITGPAEVAARVHRTERGQKGA